MGSFTHDNAVFTLERRPGVVVPNRAAAGDDAFIDRLAAGSKYSARLSRRELVAWLVARLNFLTNGQVQREFDRHNSDTGSFLLPLEVAESDGRLIGVLDVNGYPDRVVLRGGRDSTARDPRSLFVAALSAEPDWLEPCEISIVQPETKKRWSCGWDRGQFFTG